MSYGGSTVSSEYVILCSESLRSLCSEGVVVDDDVELGEYRVLLVLFQEPRVRRLCSLRVRMVIDSVEFCEYGVLLVLFYGPSL